MPFVLQFSLHSLFFKNLFCRPYFWKPVWHIPTKNDLKYLPMIICVMYAQFLANYEFYSVARNGNSLRTFFQLICTNLFWYCFYWQSNGWAWDVGGGKRKNKGGKTPGGYSNYFLTECAARGPKPLPMSKDFSHSTRLIRQFFRYFFKSRPISKGFSTSKTADFTIFSQFLWNGTLL